MILDEYLTSKEIQAVEFNANYLGVSNLLLMENAGKAVADLIASKFKPGSRIFLACGLGGNGGDGFVAARHLAARGYCIEVSLLGASKLIKSEEAKQNYNVCSSMYKTVNLNSVNDSSEVKPIEADVIVDSIIGYTYKRNLTPIAKAMINAINYSTAFKVAVDIPTGMIADTGEAPELCVAADTTITFHKPKTGFKSKSIQLGKLIVAPIGLPFEAELFTGPGDVLLVHRERGIESHKGMYGRLLVVGGNETYHGAPLLTTLGALSTGLDLCYTAVPETVSNAVASHNPSIIVNKLKGAHLNHENVDSLLPILDRADAIAVGPGLGLNDSTKKTVIDLIKIIEKRGIPMVIDADAIKAFAEDYRKLKHPAVFTPHAKEFEILTGKTAEGEFKEKGQLVQKEAQRLGAVILLKGSVDVISDGVHTRYNWTGNPGMTVGGTGDVLTGLTAGYMAQGAQPMQAACAAAFINGAAGDSVYADKGYHILPENLIQKIPYIIEESIQGKKRVNSEVKI